MRNLRLSNPRLSPHIESTRAWLTVVIGEDYYHHPLTDGRLLLAPFMTTLFTSGHGYLKHKSFWVTDADLSSLSNIYSYLLILSKRWIKYQQMHVWSKRLEKKNAKLLKLFILNHEYEIMKKLINTS